jgi:hypothetical protein
VQAAFALERLSGIARHAFLAAFCCCLSCRCHPLINCAIDYSYLIRLPGVYFSGEATAVAAKCDGVRLYRIEESGEGVYEIGG